MKETNANQTTIYTSEIESFKKTLKDTIGDTFMYLNGSGFTNSERYEELEDFIEKVDTISTIEDLILLEIPEVLNIDETLGEEREKLFDRKIIEMVKSDWRFQYDINRMKSLDLDFIEKIDKIGIYANNCYLDKAEILYGDEVFYDNEQEIEYKGNEFSNIIEKTIEKNLNLNEVLEELITQKKEETIITKENYINKFLDFKRTLKDTIGDTFMYLNDSGFTDSERYEELEDFSDIVDAMSTIEDLIELGIPEVVSNFELLEQERGNLQMGILKLNFSGEEILKVIVSNIDVVVEHIYDVVPYGEIDTLTDEDKLKLSLMDVELFKLNLIERDLVKIIEKLTWMTEEVFERSKEVMNLVNLEEIKSIVWGTEKEIYNENKELMKNSVIKEQVNNCITTKMIELTATEISMKTGVSINVPSLDKNSNVLNQLVSISVGSKEFFENFNNVVKNSKEGFLEDVINKTSKTGIVMKKDALLEKLNNKTVTKELRKESVNKNGKVELEEKEKKLERLDF